jgi:hypothetical protein
MQPLMWHEMYSDYLPLMEVYQYVVNQLDPEKYDPKQKDKAKKMREEILGNDWLGRSPDLLWDISFLVELQIRPSDWRNSDLWTQLDRAKFRAYKFIESMIGIIDKYNNYKKDQRDKLKNKRMEADDSKKRPISKHRK